MWFIGLNLLLATWLLVSAFALPQGPLAVAMSWLAGIVVAAVAVVAKAKPSARFVISALSVALGFAALLVPEMSGMARANVAVVAAVLFALSLVSPKPVEDAHAPTG
jgi:hypothetical protein